MLIGSLAEDFLKGEDLILLTSFNLEKNKTGIQFKLVPNMLYIYVTELMLDSTTSVPKSVLCLFSG